MSSVLPFRRPPENSLQRSEDYLSSPFIPKRRNRSTLRTLEDTVGTKVGYVSHPVESLLVTLLSVSRLHGTDLRTEGLRHKGLDSPLFGRMYDSMKLNSARQ